MGARVKNALLLPSSLPLEGESAPEGAREGVLLPHFGTQRGRMEMVDCHVASLLAMTGLGRGALMFERNTVRNPTAQSVTYFSFLAFFFD
jgi:hypothetical protein